MSRARLGGFLLLQLAAPIACSGFKDDAPCAVEVCGASSKPDAGGDGQIADAGVDATLRDSGIDAKDAGAVADAGSMTEAGPTFDASVGLVLGLGNAFSCALAHGVVECWGTNGSGEQGLGDAAADGWAPAHVVINHVTALGVGSDAEHACVALEGGAVACWGNNGDGRIGIGASGPPIVTVPTTVPGLSDVTSLSTGDRGTCATKADGGGVVCWGYYGPGASLTPQLVDGTTGNITSMSSADTFGCVAFADGGAACWGTNGQGCLGVPGGAAEPTAAPPLGLSNVAQVATGGSHACALLRDGHVMCWGSNRSGEVGIGSDASIIDRPMLVPGLDDIVQITAGQNDTCALHADGGTVSCWGGADFGANGQLQSSSTPQLVPSLSGVNALFEGGEHACVVLGDAQVLCWGDDQDGQLGDGKTGFGFYSVTPVPAQL